MRGSLRERRPGVWQLRIYLGPDPVTGKHRYVARQVKGGKRDAQRDLARFVTEAESLAQVKPAAIEAKRMTLAELVDEHIRRHEGSPTTLIAYRSILKTHIAPTIGRLPVIDVDPAILDRFYEHLVNDKKVSSSRVHQVHAVIRGALRRAVRWGWITSNPARDAAPPTVRHAETVLPTTEQVLAAIDAAYERDETFGMFVRLAAATGARRGELCALRWSAIDLDGATLRIDSSAYFEPHVGVVLKSTKNHSIRNVSLDAMTVDALRHHRSRMVERAALTDASLDHSAFVFSNDHDSSSPIVPDTFSRAWISLRDKTGLEGVRLHDLRHFQATMLLRSGVPVKNVSRRIGHRDAATTLNVYAHALADDDRVSADLVGDLLSPAAGARSRKTSL